MAGSCRVYRGFAAGLLLAALSMPAAHAASGADPQASADIRRTLTLLNVVGEEYREGVVDGHVVLPIEYEEAQAFLDEAQARLRGAAPVAAAASEAAFAAARTGLQAKRPLEDVRAQLDVIRTTVVSQTGIAEEVYPPAPPSAAHGAVLFADNCMPCHGEHADGRGPNAAGLEPPPANFTDREFMARETPFSFVNIISAGKGTSAMPAWADVFSLQDRWDLVSYLYTVASGRAQLAEGQGVYVANCVGCHGITGNGRGEHSAKLLAAVAPLNDPEALAQKTDEELLAAVAHGLPGSPMPAYAGKLNEAQLAAVVSYVRLLSLGGTDATAVAASGEAPRRLAGLLRLLGDQYRKAGAADAAAREQGLLAADVLLDQVMRQAAPVGKALAERDPAAAAALSERLDRISAAIRGRQPAADVVLLANPLVQSLEVQFPAADAATASSDQDQLLEARAMLDQALAAYRQGNPRAVYMVSDAYFLFDPLEKKLALTDADLAARTEARFAELRGLMGAPGQERAATELVAAIGADLDAARQALLPRESGAYSVAFQSGFIILREGFEVVLVLGALLAYVRKAGVSSMRAPILYGALAGVVASALTAYALLQLFQSAGATAEVIEGATMLLAAAVLFFVSYWLISKAEADRWQRYIQGKVKSAIATGNLFALGIASFLAVFREGTETILFYKALIDSAAGAVTALIAGFAVGALALVIVYLLYMRLGSRLPLRQFFFVTGGLLYYLAVVFAGKGVAELQGAGVLPTTPVSWVPRVDVIGLYPTAETLAVQGALLLCVVYAVLVTVRRNRREVATAEVPIEAASPGSAKS